jgi:hypothetical protein
MSSITLWTCTFNLRHQLEKESHSYAKSISEVLGVVEVGGRSSGFGSSGCGVGVGSGNLMGGKV